MCNKNDRYAKRLTFVKCMMSSLACMSSMTPFTYVAYICSEILLAKGHLGSRGESILTN